MLIDCPECGKEVSHQARACPHCGFGICSPTSYIRTECHNYNVPEGYELTKKVETTPGELFGGCLVVIVIIIVIGVCISQCCD